MLRGRKRDGSSVTKRVNSMGSSWTRIKLDKDEVGQGSVTY